MTIQKLKCDTSEIEVEFKRNGMKLKHLSNKTFTCRLCKEEDKGNLDTAKSILCWRCVHRLMTMTEKEKLKLYRRYEGNKDVQKMIENFMKEIKDGTTVTVMKEINYGTTGTVQRRRIGRDLRFANRKDR